MTPSGPTSTASSGPAEASQPWWTRAGPGRTNSAREFPLHPYLIWTGTALNLLFALGWVTRTTELLRNLPRVPNLLTPAWDAPLPPEHPRLAVIVPACNEEAAIAGTVRTLLAQEGVNLEIIAVDDRSTDRTGAILDELAAAADGGPVPLTVLHIRELPAGWMGKQNALAQGVAATRAPYLLFTDGDIFFRPDALRRAMRFTLEEGADHLVLLPTPIMKTWGEHMMISALQVYSAWAVRLWRIPDPRRKDRLGVGAFNLLRREAYDAIGGIAAFRMEVIEDVRIAVEIKRHGLRQRVALGAGLVTLHWASGALGIVRNVTKNSFAAFRFQAAPALAAALGLFVYGVLPAAGLFGPPLMRAASIVILLSILTLYFLFRREGGSSPWYALLFPLASVLLAYALLRSIVLTLARGAVVWRGTAYPIRTLRREAGPMF